MGRQTNLIILILRGIGTPLFRILYYVLFVFFFILSGIGRITRFSLNKLFDQKQNKKKLVKLYKKQIKKIKKVETYLKKTFKFKKKRKKAKKTKSKSINININFGKVKYYIGGFIGFSFLFVILFVCYLVYTLPSPKILREDNFDVSTKIYDRNGELLYQIYKDQNRTPVSLASVNQYVISATLASEDAEFYHHPGFSIRGMSRAIYKDITQNQLTGGSTITQQLVKNRLLTPEKTLDRKIKEVILAVETEMYFSKDEILEMYLNTVPYGGTAYGIEEAAKTYFDKKASDLTISEAALLAGLPKSPSVYSPYNDESLAIGRQQEVLKAMKDNGFISKEEYEEAKIQNIAVVPNTTFIRAPHFVMYVRQQLAQQFSEEVVSTGGLEVYTTLDLNIQKIAEEAVSRQLAGLTKLHVTNAAAIVLNARTGEILAMVGSNDYFDAKNDGNVNASIALRQPGSSIKVINYAYALSNGYTASTILKDSPVTIKIPGQPDYTPKNYDGQYRGNISLRQAFAESRNIPAVRVLASYGVPKMIEMGQKMGITTWTDPSNYGYSLTLGGGEVKLTDLANTYATVANLGEYHPLKTLLSATNFEGKNLLASEAALPTKQVLDPRVSYILTSILSDNNARAGSFGRNSALVIPNHPEVAVKTGTSNNLRDNLTVGYNQDYVVAVWVGNNDGSPMSRIASGITGAAPIFNDIMRTLLKDKPALAWEKPSGLVELSICSLTGSLTCNGCPTKKEYFLEENQPTKMCSPNMVAGLIEKQKNLEVIEGQN